MGGGAAGHGRGSGAVTVSAMHCTTHPWAHLGDAVAVGPLERRPAVAAVGQPGEEGPAVEGLVSVMPRAPPQGEIPTSRASPAGPRGRCRSRSGPWTAGPPRAAASCAPPARARACCVLVSPTVGVRQLRQLDSSAARRLGSSPALIRRCSLSGVIAASVAAASLASRAALLTSTPPSSRLRLVRRSHPLVPLALARRVAVPHLA
jgi:hypothetical protein